MNGAILVAILLILLVCSLSDYNQPISRSVRVLFHYRSENHTVFSVRSSNKVS